MSDEQGDDIVARLARMALEDYAERGGWPVGAAKARQLMSRRKEPKPPADWKPGAPHERNHVPPPVTGAPVESGPLRPAPHTPATPRGALDRLRQPIVASLRGAYRPSDAVFSRIQHQFSTRLDASFFALQIEVNEIMHLRSKRCSRELGVMDLTKVRYLALLLSLASAGALGCGTESHPVKRAFKACEGAVDVRLEADVMAVDPARARVRQVGEVTVIECWPERPKDHIRSNPIPPPPADPPGRWGYSEQQLDEIAQAFHGRKTWPKEWGPPDPDHRYLPLSIAPKGQTAAPELQFGGTQSAPLEYTPDRGNADGPPPDPADDRIEKAFEQLFLNPGSLPCCATAGPDAVMCSDFTC